MKYNVITAVTLLALASCVLSLLTNVQFEQGRFLLSSSSAKFSWSAVRFSTQFTPGQSLSMLSVNVTLSDAKNVYQVDLQSSDQVVLSSQVLSTATGRATYTVQFDNVQLAAGVVYKVSVAKRTEGYFAIVELFDFVVNHQSAKYITSQKGYRQDALKIEWIGDSLSCGFGNEGKSPCGFTPETENALLSFPVRTSLMLDTNARYNVVAYSGKGVVRNFASPNQTSPDPMPVYYNRTLTNDAQTIWNFASFTPDVVVITLGGNDFSTEPRPSYQQFSTGLNQLIDNVRNVYYKMQEMKIVVVCGPLKYDCYGDYSEMTVQRRRDSGDKNTHFVSLAGVLDGVDPGPDYGCSGHPSVQGDEKMSNKLFQEMKQIFN